MSESKPTDILLEESKRKIYLPQSGVGEEDNNYCILKTLNRPGHSWDQDPTDIYILHLIPFFGQEIQFWEKANPNNFASVAVPQQQHNSDSVQICPTHLIPSECSDLAKTLFLLPHSNTAPLTAEPLAPSLCNTAWIHVASTARKNPSVATSKKTS